MSERLAGTYRRSTATPGEQQMMVLLTSIGAHWRWQQPPIIRYDEFTKQGKPKSYVPDFSIGETVIIEVDGDAHVGEEEYDIKRDKYLESKGWKVMRFTNRDVLHRSKDVKAAILTELTKKVVLK